MGKASKKRQLSHPHDKNEKDREGILYKPVIHLLIIGILGLLIYSNAFHGPFQWDESDFIIGNPIVRDLSYFTEPSKAAGSDYYGAFKSRYIGYLTFALNYRLHGSDVTDYHIVNLSIHIINAMLVYVMLLLTFRTPYFRNHNSPLPPLILRGGAEGGGVTRLIPLAAALLFVSHPLQTEAVTYVFQRLASLVSMFYLLSLVMYIKGRLTQTAKLQPLNSKLFYLLSLVSAVLAMKTKENAFTLPLVLMLYEFLFFSGPVRTRLFRLAPYLLTLLIIPLTLIGIDKPAGEIISQIKDPASMGYQEISGGEYLFTQFRVIITYIRLLFLPVNQNIDYDYPIYSSLFELPVFLSLLLLLSILGVAVYLLYKSRANSNNPPSSPLNLRGELKGGYRLISFGIFWFFMTLSVESGIIPIPMIINEYRVYLPSAGAFTALVTAIVIFIIRPGSVTARQKEKAAISILILTVVLLSAATYARNMLWTDTVSLWQDVVRKSPNKPRGYNNLGESYTEKGQYQAAVEMFEKAIALKPSYLEAYSNRGFVYIQTGLFDKAVADFDKAIALNPGFYPAYINKGMLYGKAGFFDKAIEEFSKAIDIRPDSSSGYSNRGLAYSLVGDYERALKDLNKAIELDQNNTEAYGARGNIHLKAGSRQLAVSDFQKACDLGDKKGCDVLKLYLK